MDFGLIRGSNKDLHLIQMARLPKRLPLAEEWVDEGEYLFELLIIQLRLLLRLRNMNWKEGPLSGHLAIEIQRRGGRGGLFLYLPYQPTVSYLYGHHQAN